MKKPNVRIADGTKKSDLRPRAVPQDGARGFDRSVRAGENYAPAEPLDAQRQARLFETASRHFHSGEFATAKELFKQAAAGPVREVAHAARLHIRMCEQRLGRAGPALRTAEDHYNYAVALINERRLELAEEHIAQALSQCPKGDHLYYALALSRGLRGDLEGARHNMKRAIDLQPRNRITARNDPDFADIGQRPPMAELLYPERTQRPG
jgi:tetratricopeptide (TPR) repeat protein